MHTLSNVAVVLINLWIAIHYCRQIVRKKIKPSLAMWIFFTIAVIGSLVTYLSEGDYKLVDNILNSSDLILVFSVTTTILIYGDKSSKFTAFDTGCLAAVLLIMVFWLLTRSHVVAHSLIQAILVIAYFPVIKRLWNAAENTESFAAWIGMMVVAIIALPSNKGALAIVYTVRAVLCTGGLLLLMLRVELKKRSRLREA
ncbi:MAG TPA: hypothetical protein PKH77_03955 [Anaerolineae bacterium]|nr:hypothetical protein [Anaerolineae bacterium]